MGPLKEDEMEIKILSANRNKVEAEIDEVETVCYRLTEEEKVNWDTGDTRWFAEKAHTENNHFIHAQEDIKELLDTAIDEYNDIDEREMKYCVKEMRTSRNNYIRYMVLFEALKDE